MTHSHDYEHPLRYRRVVFLSRGDYQPNYLRDALWLLSFLLIASLPLILVLVFIWYAR